MATTETSLEGKHGNLHLYRWETEAPRYVAVLVHGYGEHAGRYEHVAGALLAQGAAVYAGDHAGHGRSDGERVLVEDLEDVVEDLGGVVAAARAAHPDVPVVMIGHSLGGIIATRYAQQHGDELAALVLSGPAIGGNPDIMGLLELPELPDVPIDPSWLSRDPEVGRAYAEDPLVWHGPFKRPTLQAMVTSIDRVAAGGALAMPTLWIHGELDPLVPLEATRPAIDRVRGARFEERVYPGAMHEIFNETNQDEVLADVTAFLDRQLPAR
jgi:alpha-beta hydrolase superfamily lysophospholipase